MSWLAIAAAAVGTAMQIGSQFTQDPKAKAGLNLGGKAVSLGGGAMGSGGGLVGAAPEAAGGAQSMVPSMGGKAGSEGVGLTAPTQGPVLQGPTSMMPPGMGPVTGAPAVPPPPQINPSALQQAVNMGQPVNYPPQVPPIEGPNPWERAANLSLNAMNTAALWRRNERLPAPQVHMAPVQTGRKEALVARTAGTMSPVERYLAMLRRR